MGSSLGHASLASDGADSGGSPHRVSVENHPDCPVTPLELGDAGAGVRGHVDAVVLVVVDGGWHEKCWCH